MATPETRIDEAPVALSENEQLAGINADYEERYGFHDAENYLYKAPKGLNREIVEKISEFKSEPAWMLEFRLKALEHFLARAAADLGLADDRRGRLRRHPLLRPRLRARRALLGRRPRGRQEDVRPARDPRGRAEVPRGRRRAVRVRGRLPPASARTSRSRASSSWTWTRRCASTRTSSASTSRRSSRRTTTSSRRSTPRSGRAARSSTCPPGVQRRDAAAGVLPHQHREHGPVRADADHRRRGLLRPLRRGLHRADLLDRSLHSAVVELIAKPGARIRYTTIQNWSTNVFNLVTKRAVAYEDATVEWVDGNLGSKLTMKYPAST